MYVSPTPPTPAGTPGSAWQELPGRAAAAPGKVLAVGTIGYLVPRRAFTGRVHSVFARACNLECGDTLLTLGAAGAGNGPTTLRLTDVGQPDLRDLFDIGEPVHGHRSGLRTGCTELRWIDARVWQPAPSRPSLEPAQIDARLRGAARMLAWRRDAQSSVITHEAAPVAAALREACRALDGGQATRQVDLLIGWGEGLTPAGDDFLVGLMAGLDALVPADERRRAFRETLAAALERGTPRTTPIAAHYLRLAARGHYTEPLIDARDALLSEPRQTLADAALGRALAVGATSGADTLDGLLAGLAAWLPRANAAPV